MLLCTTDPKPHIKLLVLRRTYLELCHLLFQVDDELLDPGVVGFIIIELFLALEQNAGVITYPRHPLACEELHSVRTGEPAGATAVLIGLTSLLHCIKSSTVSLLSFIWPERFSRPQDAQELFALKSLFVLICVPAWERPGERTRSCLTWAQHFPMARLIAYLLTYIVVHAQDDLKLCFRG